MIIENSQVNLYSQTQSTLTHSQKTSVQFHWGGKSNTNQNEVKATVNIQESYSSTIQSSRVVHEYEDNLSLEDRIKKMLIELLLGRLYDDKKDIALHPNKKSKTTPENTLKSNTIPQSPTPDLSNPYNNQKTREVEIKAMVYKTQEKYYQKQSVDFSALVKIQTPNQVYEMNMDISFSKELYESRDTRMVIGDESFIDPLVINYDQEVNPFENISKLRFEFDLDNNGSTELIPQLKQGAGFLALDKNNNGKIDNGSELFGPSTNNGFKELAKYDTDNNNWIDENDAVFDKLKVWSIDNNGEHSLVSLIDRNVGAIYLGEVQSGFKYQDAINQTDAIQKSNGIFIKEDGSGLGVVNSIDMVV